jgi:cytochrome P450
MTAQCQTGKRARPMSADRRPPGPKGRLLSGNLPEFREDILGFLSRCAREYGDVAAFRLGPRRILLVSNPDYIEEVLVSHARNFTKHFALRLSPLLLGNGLLTSEGDFWLRQRRLAQPVFLRERIAAYGPIMVAAAEHRLAGWREGETRDVHSEMMQISLDIVAQTLFGTDVADEANVIAAALETALDRYITRLHSLVKVPLWLPTPGNRRLLGAVRRLDAIIYRMIDQRRKDGATRDDLLSRLLRAQDDDHGRMTDKQLRDEAMTLFLAGYETTALTLSWACYLLGQYPEAEAKLAKELREVLGGRPPMVADLPRLRYAERVILESMRLYPPAYTIGREAIEACEIGGYPVRAGMTLLMSQWVMHRHPGYWENPETFDPDRWAGDLLQRLPKYAYFPFGGGARLCIGSTFAMMEAVLVLATVMRQYRCTLVPGHPVKPWPSMTLRPKDGIQVVLHRR